MPVAEIGTGPAVSIGFDTYTPPLTDVLTGDTVTWTNNSVRAHTVVAPRRVVGVGPDDPGRPLRAALRRRGAYGYYCTLHPGMVGEVDAHDVLLDPPATPAGAGRPYPCPGAAPPHRAPW